MEIQFTDFENAAYAVFTVLLTRVIVSYGLNFYIDPCCQSTITGTIDKFPTAGMGVETQ